MVLLSLSFSVLSFNNEVQSVRTLKTRLGLQRGRDDVTGSGMSDDVSEHALSITRHALFLSIEH